MDEDVSEVREIRVSAGLLASIIIRTQLCVPKTHLFVITTANVVVVEDAELCEVSEFQEEGWMDD